VLRSEGRTVTCANLMEPYVTDELRNQLRLAEAAAVAAIGER
jgi:hypothetical protein